MPIKILPDNKRQVIFSYSSYDAWKKCPLRYKRQKIDREKVSEDVSFTIPGLIVHKAAELYLKGDVPEEIFDEHNISIAVNKYSQKENVDLEKAYGSMQKAEDFICKCADNLRRFLRGKVLNSNPLESEYWFGDWDNPVMLSDNLGLQGGIDLSEYLPANKAILYDYKATYSDKNINSDQLVLYALALERRRNVEVSMGCFYFLPVNNPKYIPILDREKKLLIEAMQTAADSILSGEFIPKPGEHCARCPYTGYCDYEMKQKVIHTPVVTPLESIGSIEI